MAYITGNNRNDDLQSWAQGLRARIASGFSAYIERRARTGQMRALYLLSDAELAERGLTRDQIPLHVFRDRFGY